MDLNRLKELAGIKNTKTEILTEDPVGYSPTVDSKFRIGVYDFWETLKDFRTLADQFRKRNIHNEVIDNNLELLERELSKVESILETLNKKQVYSLDQDQNPNQ